MEPGGQDTVDGGSPATGRSHRTRRTWRRVRARTRAVRAKVRRTPAGRLGWRVGVGLLGGILLVAGIVMIPGPGQGWATVFLALAILSTEFSWARRVRHELWERMVAARDGYSRQSPRHRAVLAVLGVVAVVATLLGVFWGSLFLAGLPAWLPDSAENLLTRLPGVS